MKRCIGILIVLSGACTNPVAPTVKKPTPVAKDAPTPRPLPYLPRQEIKADVGNY